MSIRRFTYTVGARRVGRAYQQGRQDMLVEVLALLSREQALCESIAFIRFAGKDRAATMASVNRHTADVLREIGA